MSWAVRVNEIKLITTSPTAYELWRRLAGNYAARNRVREIYGTMYGRIVDVTCSSSHSADGLLADLIDRGFPPDCVRVVGGKGNVAK